MPLFIGLDLGTSGCRTIAINEEGLVKGEAYTDLPAPKRAGAAVEQLPSLWWQAIEEVLRPLTRQIDTSQVHSLCVDATSSTVLVIDEQGVPLAPALMYNDARAQSQAELIHKIAPRDSAAQGASATLAKLLWFKEQGTLNAGAPCHQADWIVGRLCGEYHVSDINNCLKLGYDPVAKQWPSWLDKAGVTREWLPRVVNPGTTIGVLLPPLSESLSLPAATKIVAGTTDSTAAVIASGAQHIGEAVTCLGSTLVIKVISDKAIVAPEHGVYSQPLGNVWLVGGASNSGGSVLLKYFNKAQLQQMTPLLHPLQPTGLDYYPLAQSGERFPINDPDMAPRVSPRPDSDVEFFQGLLEGIARIEKRGYDLLHSLGAPYPRKIFTNGGGAVNEPWRCIREKMLNTAVAQARHLQAAYGAALIALRAYQQSSSPTEGDICI